jgi:hypothetical protein
MVKLMSIVCFYRRLFELQVQGTFKRVPLGEIYVGAEVSEKIDMGFFNNMLAKAAISFCGTLVSDLHASFGNAPSTHNFEMPHLVAPLFPTFDRVVITHPGDTPPAMGTPFQETEEQRSIRRSWSRIADAHIDVRNTYSFSVHSSQVDFFHWSVVGIPMVPPIDMRHFFGRSNIRIGGILLVSIYYLNAFADVL